MPNTLERDPLDEMAGGVPLMTRSDNATEVHGEESQIDDVTRHGDGCGGYADRPHRN